MSEVREVPKPGPARRTPDSPQSIRNEGPRNVGQEPQGGEKPAIHSGPVDFIKRLQANGLNLQAFKQIAGGRIGRVAERLHISRTAGPSVVESPQTPTDVRGVAKDVNVQPEVPKVEEPPKPAEPVIEKPQQPTPESEATKAAKKSLADETQRQFDTLIKDKPTEYNRSTMARQQAQAMAKANAYKELASANGEAATELAKTDPRMAEAIAQNAAEVLERSISDRVDAAAAKRAGESTPPQPGAEPAAVRKEGKTPAERTQPGKDSQNIEKGAEKQAGEDNVPTDQETDAAVDELGLTKDQADAIKAEIKSFRKRDPKYLAKLYVIHSTANKIRLESEKGDGADKDRVKMLRERFDSKVNKFMSEQHFDKDQEKQANEMREFLEKLPENPLLAERFALLKGLKRKDLLLALLKSLLIGTVFVGGVAVDTSKRNQQH